MRSLLAFGLLSISLFAADAPSYSLVSWNLASQPGGENLARVLERHPELAQADVYFFQEVHRSADGLVATQNFAQRRGLHHHFVAAHPGDKGASIGLAIVSRFPLEQVESIPLEKFDLTFRSRTRVALAALASTPQGPLRLFNVHLDTRITAQQRLQQLEPVLERARASAGPVLIGGDLNTNPLYWQKGILPLPLWGGGQAARVFRQMEKEGFRSALPLGVQTHDLPGFQLDWVFSRQLEPTRSRIYSVRESDHHALHIHFGS